MDKLNSAWIRVILGVILMDLSEAILRPICSLNKDSGSCAKNLTRYYFDKDSRACQSFTWGGCGGNKNRFDTIVKCNDACRSSPDEISNDSTKSPEEKDTQLLEFNDEDYEYYDDKFIKENKDEEVARNISDEKDGSICGLPVEIGNCSKHIPRFFYNTKSESCQFFIWKGCSMNDNNFASVKKCLDKCHGVVEKEFLVPRGEAEQLKIENQLLLGEIPLQCTLPRTNQSCQERTHKFYYNPKKNICVKRLHCTNSDIHGYDSLKTCLRQCRPRLNLNRCKEPMDPGTCKKNFRLQFYFDSKQKKCLKFYYSGCNGNGNRFDSITGCIFTCKLKQQFSIQGVSRAVKYFNYLLEPSFQSTKIPAYGVCSLASETGPCEENTVQYFHNAETGECETFVYGGCHGNGNNFDSLESCEEHCIHHTYNDACLAQKQRGYCLEKQMVYHYDKNKKSCLPYIYGGCGGNLNRFSTMKHCQKTCSPSKSFSPASIYTYRNGLVYPYMESESQYLLPHPLRKPSIKFKSSDSLMEQSFLYPLHKGSNEEHAFPLSGYFNRMSSEKQEICSRPKFTGPCQNYVIRYYYNVNSQRCEPFYFGGCLDNGNNFYELESCINYCTHNDNYPESCIEPREEGTCEEKIKQYYYEKDTGSCFPFIYSGCGGNGNRYDSKKDCEIICSPHFMEMNEEKVEFHDNRETFQDHYLNK